MESINIFPFESNVDTYVINMDRDVTRLEDFDKMMKRLEWNYQRFPAINMKDKPIDKGYISKYSVFLTNSEIGCALSHIELWQKLADGDKDRMIIFEDDARTYIQKETFSEMFNGFYSHLQENNIEEPDILYLGKALDRCEKYERVWKNVYRSKHPVCLHAYIITKKGAKKMLKLAPFSGPIDMVIVHAASNDKLNLMVFHPSLFFQDVLNTTSNLRSLTGALNVTTECIVTQQYIYVSVWATRLVFIILIVVLCFCNRVLSKNKKLVKS